MIKLEFAFLIGRAHRCALLASSNFTGQLLEFAFQSNLRREHIMALGILNWKTAAHYGAPSGKNYFFFFIFPLPLFKIN